MRSATLMLSAATILICAGLARAQWGWPYGGYYANTPGMSYAMGMSDMVRSAGMATLMTSKAASVGEDALSKHLDNTVKYSRVYDEQMRRARSLRAQQAEERASKRRAPPTSEQVHRWAHQGVPKPLTSSQLDPVTGAIVWPVALRDDHFEPYRRSTQEFFSDAVAHPETFSFGSYQRLQSASDKCLADLKSRINQYGTNDYIQAKNFIASLNYAAQQL